LELAGPDTHVIGVDPSPRLRMPRKGNWQIYECTSDAFFHDTAPHILTGLPTIKLAFIDGLHTFEQVLLDFTYLEPYCDPNGIIVLHDTFPVAEVPASTVRESMYWCGDVWKILSCLEHYRPDLQIITLPSFPSGLTLITGLDPANGILKDIYHEAIQRFGPQPFVECHERATRIKGTILNELAVTANVAKLFVH
jgi:hypothetical protein